MIFDGFQISALAMIGNSITKTAEGETRLKSMYHPTTHHYGVVGAKKVSLHSNNNNNNNFSHADIDWREPLQTFLTFFRFYF